MPSLVETGSTDIQDVAGHPVVGKSKKGKKGKRGKSLGYEPEEEEEEECLCDTCVIMRGECMIPDSSRRSGWVLFTGEMSVGTRGFNLLI